MLETAWEDRWLPDQKRIRARVQDIADCRRSESSKELKIRMTGRSQSKAYLENFIQRKMIRKS